jgi:TonB family protein
MKSIIRAALIYAIGTFASPSFGVAIQNCGNCGPLSHDVNAEAHGIYRPGGDVSVPVLIHSVKPEYTEAARKAKVSGDVLLNLYVDTHGNPTHIHVMRGLGLDLDEKAVAAVRQYKFTPGMKAGKPVIVDLNLTVNFSEPTK